MADTLDDSASKVVSREPAFLVDVTNTSLTNTPKKSKFIIPSLPKSRSTPQHIRNRLDMRKPLCFSTTKSIDLVANLDKIAEAISPLPPRSKTPPPVKTSSSGLTLYDIRTRTCTKKKPLSESSPHDLDFLSRRLDDYSESRPSAIDAIMAIFKEEQNYLSSISTAILSDDLISDDRGSTPRKQKSLQMQQSVLSKMASAMEHTTREQLINLPMDVKQNAVYWTTFARYEACHALPVNASSISGNTESGAAQKILEEGIEFISNCMEKGLVSSRSGEKEIANLKTVLTRFSVMTRQEKNETNTTHGNAQLLPTVWKEENENENGQVTADAGLNVAFQDAAQVMPEKESSSCLKSKLHDASTDLSSKFDRMIQITDAAEERISSPVKSPNATVGRYTDLVTPRKGEGILTPVRRSARLRRLSAIKGLSSPGNESYVESLVALENVTPNSRNQLF